ncbi:MAG: helix-turn-helix domain-containing protein [Alphaproteobacteria bacterium]|nr:MAG: helix-turn-helix domain-containing protein [Alphaproteobacteria bacterium]
MTKWTPTLVADRMEEAVATLRRLPPVKVRGYFSVWPTIKFAELEVLQQEKLPIRLRAQPDAIDRLEETLTWMPWLEVEERKLLWKRGAKMRWKAICWEFGCDRSTAWRKWVIALTKVSAQLNASKG